MITVSKSSLKAKMLEYLRITEESGEEIIITNNRKPTLKIVKIKNETDPDLVFKDLRDKAIINDSILKPETEEWGNL